MDTTTPDTAQDHHPTQKRPSRTQRAADIVGGLVGAHHAFASVARHLAGPSHLMWTLGVPAPVQLAVAVAVGVGLALLPAKRAARAGAGRRRPRQTPSEEGPGADPPASLCPPGQAASTTFG